MQQTLKRYFGERLTEKMLDNEGEIQGDNYGDKKKQTTVIKS